MPIEAATTINQLDATRPGINDLKSEGDDHLRLVKATIKATLPNITGVVTPTHVELNHMAGATSPLQAQITAETATRQAQIAAETAARIASDAIMLQANAVWVSGTTYVVGDLRYSPLDFQTYRRKTAGAGAIDPSLDATNWAFMGTSTAQLQAIALLF